MNKSILNTISLLMLAFIPAGVSAAESTISHGAIESWNFRVLLDDTPIGYHKVRINKEQNIRNIHTTANFDVTFLFIPVYSYEHETRETWQDGCLVSINSKTDDNGDNYFINSVQGKNNILLSTQDGNTSIDGCVRTFAYWDIELLKAERLLNTQTGEYQPVSITNLGVSYLTIDDEKVEAHLYRLVCEDMVIDLWYTSSMNWLALETKTESGAIIRYLPDNLAEFRRGAES